MPIQFSDDVRDGRVNAIETAVGTAPVLRIRTGVPPANCAAARTGTVLASLTLPTDWMGAASGGVVDKLGAWEDTSADAAGTAGHYEVMNSGLTTCHIQGTVTMTGGGGDMEMDNTNIAVGQNLTVNTYQLTDANS
jgi:hypothetical protein